MEELTHFDASGRARMVDVGSKDVTERVAVARGSVTMEPTTLETIRRGKVAKGDVLGVAQVAGIMAAKNTSALIPMTHPLALTSVEMAFKFNDRESRVEIQSRLKVRGQTGVEMEALTAVTVAALTIYDMCKAIDRGMTIGEVRLVYKSGGKSGTFVRKEDELWGE